MKTKIIKLKNGSLEIVLCGAIHIGTQNYFNQLNAIANECDIVLFEGVSAITLDKFKLFYIKLGKLIGLPTQNRIGYENNEKWINSDMNYEIFKHYMKKNVIEELNVEDIDETIKDFDEKDKKFIRWIILFLIKNMNFISMFIKAFGDDTGGCTGRGARRFGRHRGRARRRVVCRGILFL